MITSPFRRLANECANRLIVAVQLLVCGLGVLIAPQFFLRYLKREFESL